MTRRPRAGWSSALALLVGGALAAVARAEEPPMATAASDTTNGQLQAWDEKLRTLRTSVWSAYDASASFGQDARARTLAQDLDEWVMTDPVRLKIQALHSAVELQLQRREEQAAAAKIKEGSAATEEQTRLLSLVQVYWLGKVALDRQRDLWSSWLAQVPEAAAADSRTRLQGLEAALMQAFSPTEPVETLRARILELERAYNDERIKLAAIVAQPRLATGPPFSTWIRTTPCPRSDGHGPDTGGADRRISLVHGPNEAAPFYPADASRDQIAGTVYLRMRVSETGCLERAEVTQSSGAPELDEAALDYCQYLRFEPAVEHGRAVAGQTSMPVAFKLHATPSSVEVASYISRGHEQMTRHDYAGAIADYSRAIELEPRAAMAYADRGLAHVWLNEKVQGRADLDTAYAIDPNNPVVYRARALLALSANELQEAAVGLSTSLEKEPRNVFALLLRAEVYLTLGEPNQALADTAAIILLQPEHFRARALRALILRMQNNAAASMAEAAAVVAAEPEDPQAYVLAANIYAASGDIADSLRVADQAVQRLPSESSYLARAEMRKYTDTAAARADIEAALQLEPQSRRALSMLAALQSDSGAYEDAIRTLNTAIRSEGGGNDNALLISRAVAYAKNHQTQQAQEDLQAAHARANSADELNQLCWTLGTAGVALAEALNACDEAIAKAILPGPMHDSRGLVLLRLARYRESVAAYDAALRSGPLSPASLYGRGLAKRGLGDVAAGDQDIRLALKANATIAQQFAGYGLSP